MNKRVAFFVGLVLLLPVAAGAAVEVTLSTGVRSGAASFPIEADSSVLILCVTTPCVLADATTEDGQLGYSLIVDVPISSQWMIEGLYSRQDGDLELRSSFAGEFLNRETFDAATALVGLLREWRQGRWRPFAAGALGVTRFESSALAYDRPFFPGILARPVGEDALSASLAGGLKTDLGRHLALRLEGRFYWHDLSERLGGTLRQDEASVGLSYRW